MTVATNIQPVVLTRHQATGDEVLPRDLGAVQDHVQKAIADLQRTKLVHRQLGDKSVGTNNLADGAVTGAAIPDHSIANVKLVLKTITGASIADNTVAAAEIVNNSLTDAQVTAKALTNASIANGTINQPLLENFLRSTCKYVVAADQALTMGAPVSFATKIVDPFSATTPQVTGVAITPIASGLLNWKVALRLTGGNVNAGRAAHIIITDTTFGSIIAAGQECGGFTDEYGVDTIVARFDEAVSVIAGHTYNVSFILLTKVPASYTGTPWVGTATVKTFTTVTYTDVSTGTPFVYNVAGSFLQLEPRAQ